MYKNKLIPSCPAWFTKICIKPRYNVNGIEILWDIPEYTGLEDIDKHALRPDGKIILEHEKIIYVLEMSVPWIENRGKKFEEKEEKYQLIVQNIKISKPGYVVKQLTFIMDCLGGYSKDLTANLKLLKFTQSEVDKIIFGMQKIILSEATAITRYFKILTTK